MTSKVELVRLVLKDVLRVQITEAEAEKVLARIEALHEKEAVEHSVQADVACTCGSTAFYNDKVLGKVCCRCQSPHR